MKLPDKVYLNKFMIRPGMLHPAEFPPDNPEEEYIRKEAILEWANGLDTSSRYEQFVIDNFITHINSL